VTPLIRNKLNNFFSVVSGDGNAVLEWPGGTVP